MESKVPVKTKIWNTATCLRSDIRQWKTDLLDKVWRIYQKTGRRPYKSDFLPVEYKGLFTHCGGLSGALDTLGLSHLPIKRPWMSARRFRTADYWKKYYHNYYINHPEKVAKWRLTASASYKDGIYEVSDEQKKRNSGLAKIRRIKTMKKCLDCDRLVLKSSLRCYGCNNLINNRLKGKKAFIH